MLRFNSAGRHGVLELLTAGERIAWAHVADSRAYRFVRVHLETSRLSAAATLRR